MFEREKSGVWVRVILSLVLLAVLLGGGYAIYRFGFTQGALAVEAGDFWPEGWHDHPMMPYRYPMHGRGFFPFGSLLFGFFFLMLVFALFRRIIFGPRWARWGYGYGSRGFHGHPGHPRWDREKDVDQVPPEEESTG
jgi:hypothetical protein